MAKKPVKKTQVIPNPKDIARGGTFDDLADGDYFIMDGELWQRVDSCECNQAGINSLTGDVEDDLCERSVVPVAVTITWAQK